MLASPSEMRGVGRSRDGLVHAVVGSDGAPTELTIAPDAMRLTARELSTQILAAIRLAHQDVVAQFTEHIERLGPPSDPGHARANAETMAQIEADVQRVTAAAAEQVQDIVQRLTAITGDLPPRRPR